MGASLGDQAEMIPATVGESLQRGGTSRVLLPVQHPECAAASGHPLGFTVFL